MGFDLAVRVTEVLLAMVLVQQSLEQMAVDPAARGWLALRLAFCAALLAGQGWAVWCLMALGLWWLKRYDGPFNGGSDKMTLLVLACLSGVEAALALDRTFWAEMAFGYLAIQLVLSYFISGQVKLVNPAWRRGEALREVFLYSAYPVSERLRGLAERRLVTFWGAWVVMLVEMAFPLFLLHPLALAAGLTLAAGFHFSNACLFGLNRFFWIWLCAFPALIWLQGRLVG